jgi:hypothetical protein
LLLSWLAFYSKIAALVNSGLVASPKPVRRFDDYSLFRKLCSS